MDWKILLLGKKPETIFEYEKALKNSQLMMWVFVVVTVFIFFGVLQQNAEVDRCWDDLKTYRMADSIIGGVPVSNCFIEDERLICTDDLSSIT